MLGSILFLFLFLFLVFVSLKESLHVGTFRVCLALCALEFKELTICIRVCYFVFSEVLSGRITTVFSSSALSP